MATDSIGPYSVYNILMHNYIVLLVGLTIKESLKCPGQNMKFEKQVLMLKVL